MARLLARSARCSCASATLHEEHISRQVLILYRFAEAVFVLQRPSSRRGKGLCLSGFNVERIHPRHVEVASGQPELSPVLMVDVHGRQWISSWGGMVREMSIYEAISASTRESAWEHRTHGYL